MFATIPFKRLVLRAVLRDVSPMVARLISVSDDTELSDLHDVFIGYNLPGLRRGDYMAVPDDGLDELEPAMTIVGGKIVYETGR